MGHEVSTIVPVTRNARSILNRFAKKRDLSAYLSIFKGAFRKLLPNKYRNLIRVKSTKLKFFSKLYLNEVFVDVSDLRELVMEYDYFIVGSDQVWNEKWTKDFYFLNFSPKEKNIAYAASIGNDKLSNDYKSLLIEKLKNFKSISLREKNTVEIIRELIGIGTDLVLDPTLLLSDEEWRLLARKSEIKLEKKYLLTYFLGPAPDKEVNRTAKKFNLKIINLFNPKDTNYISASVEDFINLFMNASFVMTDSFHGTIFSIIFEKKFMTISRDDMNSRLVSLFDLLVLNDRHDKVDFINSEIDFINLSKILNKMREASHQFLVNSLK
jgi:hypothetical protein